MRQSTFLAAYAALFSLEIVSAYPGMGDTLSEVAQIASEKRQSPSQVEMIGDLRYGSTTTTGTTVKQCLVGQILCFDNTKKV
jgi:hypothetical protein